MPQYLSRLQVRNHSLCQKIDLQVRKEFDQLRLTTTEKTDSNFNQVSCEHDQGAANDYSQNTSSLCQRRRPNQEA